ncbi:MAG TPA: dipeptidase [Bacillota bacterium]
MKIIDTHCDALYKLQNLKRKQGDLSLNFSNDEQLDTNYTRLQAGHVMVQFFAIFIEPHIPADEKWQHALEQIDLFHSEIIHPHRHMKHMKRWSDIDRLDDGEIGAVLTLEGADAFGNDLAKLRQLYREGVLSLGLTWNYANLCADGAKEPRGGGLTLLGREVVALNNEHHVFTDVSHTSVQAFWDIIELADYPIASHSNARALCDHPRNLFDDQAKALFQKNGLIHLVFNPPFINDDREEATISDLIKHIDHFCSLGGKKRIGFGSDFDGISTFVEGLENSAHYERLINELLKYYSEADVKGFAYKNFLNHRPSMTL